MPDIQSPTLIIGLGGTGVAVLRKFKQRYIELYGTDERLVKLLAIDTAQQPNMTEALLSSQEFLHLGRPPINVASVISNAANEPALDWLRGTRIPGFQIGIGAGMKRFYGHIAYFFKGLAVRAKIDQAVHELMLASANIVIQGGRSGFRVFIVSSLCGGTGTGMYLDIAYMAHDVVTRAGLGAPQSFGFLFLPSAFQELKGNNFWKSINANGYAALQELQYYMSLRQRPEGQPTLRMPDNQRTTIQISSEPFQYCYLVGGVNEAGQPVAKSADLYDRTAEFLFMSATSDIGAQLTSVAVDGDRCFASFGSCNLQLPQARSLQKYFALMGREILNDVFGPLPDEFSVPRISERFGAISGYVNPDELSRDAAAFLEEEVFIRHNMRQADSRQALSTIEHLIADIKSSEPKFHEGLLEKSRQIAREARELIAHEVNSAWNLEAGTLQRAVAIIDTAVTEINNKRKSLQLQASPADYDEAFARFKSISKLGQLFTKGDSLLASFRELATRTFESRAHAAVASQLGASLAAVAVEFQQLRDKLVELSRRNLEVVDRFNTAATAHLQAIAQEQGNLGLLDATSITEDDDYRTDRVGLVRRCRSRQEVRASIGSPEKANVSIDTLVKALFTIVDEYVEQKAFKGDFIDDEFYRRLVQSKINLQTHETFRQPRRDSYLFINGSDELQSALAAAIEMAPDGFRKPQVLPGVNPGSATFVRIVAEVKLKDLVEMEQMASAYDEKSHSADAIYLDLPTHKRASIIETSSENLGPELFAFGQVLVGVMDVGQNYLLHGQRMLLHDEPDPVRRRKAVYDAVLTPDIRSEIKLARNSTAQNLGGNTAFVPFMRDRISQLYASIPGNQEYRDLLLKEKAAAEAYLGTLPVQPQSVGAEHGS